MRLPFLSSARVGAAGQFRAPKLSPLQILVHIGAWVPLAVLIFDARTDNLTINPIQAAEQRTGLIAFILLALSLACTPLNTLFRWRAPMKVRRPLGLYAYLYATLHLLLFVGLDYGFDFSLILADVGEKSYILLGLTAFILLTLLAITSFDWWKVHLRKNWKHLHRLVYLINLLVVLHFGLSVKGDFFRLQGDIFRPLLALTVVTLLLAARIPAIRKKLAAIQR